MPALSQDNRYQDILDDIYARHPDWKIRDSSNTNIDKKDSNPYQMPVIVPKTKKYQTDSKTITPSDAFMTNTENSPIVKLLEEGWSIPDTPSNRKAFEVIERQDQLHDSFKKKYLDGVPAEEPSPPRYKNYAEHFHAHFPNGIPAEEFANLPDSAKAYILHTCQEIKIIDSSGVPAEKFSNIPDACQEPSMIDSSPKEVVVHHHHHYDTYDLLKMQPAAPPEPAQNNSSPGWYDYMLFSDSLMQANENLQRSLYPPYPPPYYPPSVYDMRHGYVPPSGCCQYPW